MKKSLPFLLAAAALAAGLAVSATATAKSPSMLTVVLKGAGTTEYVSATGHVSTTYPGQLVTGDRILGNGTDYVAGKPVGFDNEICTVTFDGNDLCHEVAVLTGKGDVELTWLWVGRNNSTLGPSHWSGIVDGGTGVFAHVHGAYDARLLANGALQVSVPLG